MPRQPRELFVISRPPTPEQDCAADELSHYVYAVFRPIRECADDVEKEVVRAICGGLIRRLVRTFIDGKPDRVQVGLESACRAVRDLDVLGFDPEEYLKGFDVGEKTARKWASIVGSPWKIIGGTRIPARLPIQESHEIYPLELIRDRIDRAKQARTEEARAALAVDYPSTRTDPTVFPTRQELCAFLEHESKWSEALLRELREQTHNFHGAPARIMEFDRSLEQHGKDARLLLNEWRETQSLDGESGCTRPMLDWYTRGLTLYENGGRLRALAKRYFGVDCEPLS